jgi:ribulose 1,5-bisphosphate synthetase/thiazole synthase
MLTNDFVKESSRSIEVIENVDVVVAGGGPGGIPAAVAAARRGCSVLLIERYGFLGGLATGGLMGPLFGYAFCESPLILGGIPVELLRKLQEIGGAPANGDFEWQSIRFDPCLLKHVSDQILVDAGVNILLHAWAVDVVKTNGRIDAVIIESKSGRQAVKCKMVIDATGDGDVANFCGCEYTQGRVADGKTQSMGTKFKIGGVDMDNMMNNLQEREIVNKAIDEKRIPAYHSFGGEISEQGITLRDGEITPTVTRCAGDATNVYDLTRAEINIRHDTLAIVDFYKKHVPGYENAFLMETPAAVGIRETRQIVGLQTLTGDDVLRNRKRDDTIARGCWFLDIHCPLGLYCGDSNLCSKKCTIKPDCIMKKKYPEQLYDTLHQDGLGEREDTWYDIPYGCIVPEKMDNLLISGRCISADHGGMSSARVIATCFAVGEAAGAAAALSLKNTVTPGKLEVPVIQQDLRKAGVPLGDDVAV